MPPDAFLSRISMIIDVTRSVKAKSRVGAIADLDKIGSKKVDTAPTTVAGEGGYVGSEANVGSGPIA